MSSLPDEALQEIYNRTGPAEDREKLVAALAQYTATASELAGSSPNPFAYGRQVVDRLCPIMLPYRLGSDASFDFAGFNGRNLADDVMDVMIVMITLASNFALSDGVAPDKTRIRTEFPYFGAPFSAREQVGNPPVPKPPRKAEGRP